MNRSVIFSLLREFVIVLLSFTPLSAFAQSTTLTAGTDVSDAWGSVSYSIGQMIYETAHTDNGNSYGGVQQPFDLLFVSTEVLVIEHYSGKMLICDNHEGQFVSFTWYKDGVVVGTDNFYYESTGLDGVYYLEVTDEDGNLYVSRHFSYTLSEVSKKSLSIYPMPANKGEDIHILLNDEIQRGESQTTTMFIFESSGRIVYTQEMEINVPLSLNISSFLCGSYIVKVSDLSSQIIVR